MIAAALHDFYKRREIEIAASSGYSWEAFHRASEQATQLMREVGFSERVVRFANAPGHDSVIEIDPLLERETLSEEELAFLAMHYVDIITTENYWFDEVEVTSTGKKNALDRRLDMAEAFPKYQRINEEGRKYFHGETMVQALRRTGKLIEQRLTGIINQRSGTAIDSLDLPTFLDSMVKREISEIRSV